MARFFQFQNKTQPTATGEQLASPVASWLQRWTEPPKPKIAARLAIALIASGSVLPPPQITAATAVSPSVFSSEVIFPKSFIYQSKVDPTLVSEIITVDKWHEPFSQPLFKKTSPTNQQTLAFQFPIPEVPIGGVPVNLEGPPSSFKLFQYQTNTYVPVSETSTVDKWLKPLNEPPKTKKLPTSQQQSLAWSTFTPAPPVVATSAISSQVTFKSRLIYQSEAYVQVVSTETITVDKWFEAFSEPVRTRKLPTAEQQSFTTGYLPDPSKFIEGWYRPFNDPVRIKPKVAFQQDLAWSTFTPTAAAATFAEAFSSGVIFPKSIIYQSHTEPQLPQPTTFTFQPLSFGDTGLTFQKTIIYQINAEALTPAVTEDMWHKAWSEPVRIKPRTCFYQDFFWSTFTPTTVVTPAVESAAVTPGVTFPRSFIYQSLAWLPQPTPPNPVVTVFPIQPEGDTGLFFQKTIIYQISAEALSPDVPAQWFEPLSGPYLKRRGLATYQQQSLAWSTFTPIAAVTAVIDKTETSQVIFPKSIIYQSLAWNPFTPPSEAIFEDKWHRPWSEPVRLKKGLRADEQQVLAWSGFTPAFTEPRWYQPLSEPVRTRRFPTSEQQVLAWSTFTPAAAVNIPVFGSFSGTIYKSRLIYQSYTAPFFIPAFTDVRWYQPLSEPVRLKKGLGAPYQQSFTTDPTYIPAASKLPRWWYPWSEPVRIKLALRTANQAAFFAPSLVIPTPPFVTLVEPIEPMVFFERFFIYDPQTAPVFAQSVVTATMFAVETNNDSADFEIVVHRKAHRAHVSIKEIRIGDDAYASIEET